MIRRRTGTKVYLLCGLIFTLTGSIAVATALLMEANMDVVIEHGQGDVETLPLIFGLTGGIALALGIVLLVLCRRASRTKRQLLERGESILAEITDFPLDYSIMVNGWPTYRVECSYRDPRTGTVHVFQSDNLRFDPSRYVTQRTVRVYVDKSTGFDNYYVDVDAILPDIRRH